MLADKLLVQEVQHGVLQQESSSDCDCLQACTVLDYEAETTQADLDWKVFMNVKALNLQPSGYVKFYLRTSIL